MSAQSTRKMERSLTVVARMSAWLAVLASVGVCLLAPAAAPAQSGYRLMRFPPDPNNPYIPPTAVPPVRFRHWNLRELPDCRVPYDINRRGHHDAHGGDEFEAVERAATDWNFVSPALIELWRVGVTFIDVATKDDFSNVLMWENGPHGQADDLFGPVDPNTGPSGVIATSFVWARDNAQIFQFDIVFNDRDFQWNTDKQNLQDVQTAHADPFAITNGQTLTVRVDGVPQEVTFAGVTEGAASATEVRDNIRAQVAGVWTDSVGLPGGYGVRIQSKRADGRGTIWAIGGTALPALGFSGGQRTTRLLDVQTIAVHELGHSLGIGHSETPEGPGEPVMHPVAKSALKRLLTEEDEQALNFLYSPDLGDAPDPCGIPPVLNEYPSLVHRPPPDPPPPEPCDPNEPTDLWRCLNGWPLYLPLRGPYHLFGYRGTGPFAGDRFEWLGDDMDDSELECESLQVTGDLLDDGVDVNPPHPPPAPPPDAWPRLSPLAPNRIVVTIRHTAQDGRYVAGDPLRRLYLNGYADWAPIDCEFADNDAERVIWWEGVPGLTITASPTFRAALYAPGVIRLVFVVLAAPAETFWWRFRLDYGENEARATGVPVGGWDGAVGAVADGNLGPAVGAAQFGEVEDYHFFVVNDCNGNGSPDECETDPMMICCGGPDEPPCRPDLNGNILPDECDDCRGAGGPPDELRIAWGLSQDYDGNGIPDECQIDPSLPAFFNDYNGNGIPDTADVDPSDPDGNGEVSADCDGNGVPDEIEDCNGNGIGDACEIAADPSLDCNQDGVLNECEPDCNGNGTPDPCEPYDCNANGVPDDCDINPADPDGNGLFSPDCNGNGLPDECEDCNGNGIADECDVNPADPDGNGLVSPDCNANGYPDECEFDPIDCNANGVPDKCDIVVGTSPDCNRNYVPDECDIASGLSADTDENGIPDECQICRGDMNCDEVVNFGDINPFVLFLSDFAAWVAAYPGCLAENGDINGDGVYPAFGDINPFVALMVQSPLACGQWCESRVLIKPHANDEAADDPLCPSDTDDSYNSGCDRVPAGPALPLSFEAANAWVSRSGTWLSGSTPVKDYDWYAFTTTTNVRFKVHLYADFRATWEIWPSDDCAYGPIEGLEVAPCYDAGVFTVRCYPPGTYWLRVFPTRWPDCGRYYYLALTDATSCSACSYSCTGADLDDPCDDVNDYDTNAGCDDPSGPPPQYMPFVCGATYCGRSYAGRVTGAEDYDPDWFTITNTYTSPRRLRLTVTAELLAHVEVFLSCADYDAGLPIAGLDATTPLVGGTTCPNMTMTATTAVPPGTVMYGRITIVDQFGDLLTSYYPCAKGNNRWKVVTACVI